MANGITINASSCLTMHIIKIIEFSFDLVGMKTRLQPTLPCLKDSGTHVYIVIQN